MARCRLGSSLSVSLAVNPTRHCYGLLADWTLMLPCFSWHHAPRRATRPGTEREYCAPRGDCRFLLIGFCYSQHGRPVLDLKTGRERGTQDAVDMHATGCLGAVTLAGQAMHCLHTRHAASLGNTVLV